MDRTLLARATDSSDAPTPGYLYVDIAKNAASSPVACQEMAQYLCRRLQNKQSPNIKYKVLKVIAKTAASPATRGHFQRAISQDASSVSAIKAALQFRGPMDPARGDEPNQRVRTAAKEALDAIYSDAPTAPMGTATGPMTGIGGGGGGGVSASYGSSPYASSAAMSSSSGGGMGMGGGPRKMEGIGNPRFKDPRLEQTREIGNMTIGELAKEASETIVGMIKDPLAKGVDAAMPHHGGYGAGGGYSGPPGRSQMMAQTGGQWTMASNRGPNAIGSSSNTYGAGSSGNTGYNWSQTNPPSGATATGGGVGGSWGAAPVAASAPSIASQARAPPHASASQPYVGITPSTNMSGSGGTAVSDGSFEVQMVKELCPPGGMKAEPPPDKLARFSQAVATLNADLICPALLDMLEEGNPWMMRAKALCVIQVAIERGNNIHTNTNPYADFFYTCRGEMEPLAQHSRAQVRGPARRCLELLGVNLSELGAAAPAPTSAPPPAPPAADLLDFGSDEPAPAAPQPTMPPPAPPTSTPAASAPGGLFGGLSVQGSAPAAPPAAPAPTPGFDSLLGGGGAAVSQPAPATRSDSLLDMPSAPAPSGGGGLFDSMTMKGSGDAQENQAPPPPPTTAAAAPADAAAEAAPPSGSAFSFMNSEQPPPPAQPAASPTIIKSKPVFDPLLMPQAPTNPSPNTMKQMMSGGTLTAQQLQVMYAQQQMMMMSQQMQQMQLAMAMQQQQQQKRGSVTSAPTNPNVMQNNQSFAASTSFQFMDDPATKKKKEKDAKFDFIQDAMKHEKK